MADQKLTELSAVTSIAFDDLLYTVVDPSGSPVSRKITKEDFFKFADGTVIFDANGNEILKILKTTGAVNEVIISNAASGNMAKIASSGETNIGLLLTGKGTGKVTIGDAVDNTKALNIDLVDATTAKTVTLTSSHTDNRTITLPNATTTIVGTDTSQTLTNKTINGSNNTITNLAHGAAVDNPTSGVHGVTGSVVGTTDTQTLSNKTLTAPKFADLGYIADTSNYEFIIFDSNTNAVNEIKISNAASTDAPEIAASGDGANVSLKLAPKGTGVVFGAMETFAIAVSDESTALTTTGNPKITFRMPYAFHLVKAKASLSSASTSGVVTVDVKEGGTTIFGANQLTIDQDSKTSVGSTPQVTYSDNDFADDAEMTIDINAAGANATAKGLKVYLIGYATARPA